MQKHVSPYLILCFSALFLVTACGTDDLTSALTASGTTFSQPSFDETAEKLAGILQLAGDHNWLEQRELIMDLMKPDRSLTPAETEAAEAGLGISYAEFNRLTSELGTAAHEYARAIVELGLAPEEQAAMVYDAVSASAPLAAVRSQMVDEQGRCLLEDLCNIIGYFFVDVWLEFNCDFFCEEEALPLYALVNAICGIFAC